MLIVVCEVRKKFVYKSEKKVFQKWTFEKLYII